MVELDCLATDKQLCLFRRFVFFPLRAMVGFRLCRALLDAVGDGLSRFTTNASHPSKPFDWKIPPLVRRTAPLLAPASHPGFEFKNGVAAGVHANNGPICRHAARFFFWQATHLERTTTMEGSGSVEGELHSLLANPLFHYRQSSSHMFKTHCKHFDINHRWLRGDKHFETWFSALEKAFAPTARKN